MTEYSRQLKLAKSGYPRGMGQFGQLLDDHLQINAGLGPKLTANFEAAYCMKPPTEGFKVGCPGERGVLRKLLNLTCG